MWSLNVTLESQLFIGYSSNEANISLNAKQSEIQFAWGLKFTISPKVFPLEMWTLLSSPTFL